MKKILLSKNWNEKLCCDAFLIIKPASSDFKTGEQVIIETKLNKVFIEETFLISSNEYFTYLKDIPEAIFYADTGLSKYEATKLYLNAYKGDKGWNVLVLERVKIC